MTHDTPLYKYAVALRMDEGVVFARNADEADDIAAALCNEPQRTGKTGRVRTKHHPILRGGLYEFTWGERLAEAHLRQRSAGCRTATAFAQIRRDGDGS